MIEPRRAPATPLAAYDALVASGALKPDSGQRDAMIRLDRLAATLARRGKDRGWSRLFTWSGARTPVCGLYLWGGVGRGKTMMMDLFHRASAIHPKRRVHFHAFMDDVHARIHRAREEMKEGRVKTGDPIPLVARALAEEARLLCLDEFQVADIADAMILGRLFDRLFEDGVVMVATSNTPPRELYAGGLNRDLFLPFVDRLEERVSVVHLEAGSDYRREKLLNARLYVTPLGPQADSEMDRLWMDLTGGAAAEPRLLALKGRTIPVPRAAGRVARFGFGDLFEKPLGPADYLKIAETFDTVLVDGVPALGAGRRNEARRMIMFVDALYDCGTKLALSAAAEPDALAPQGDHAAEFARTASRLLEMRSADYLGRDARTAAPINSGDTADVRADAAPDNLRDSRNNRPERA